MSLVFAYSIVNYLLLLILQFLFGGVSSSSWCLGKAGVEKVNYSIKTGACLLHWHSLRKLTWFLNGK